jgi:glutamate/tyrosine decarboxylase-like PLP-dependent enzyme
METILNKRRASSWRDLGGKAEDLKKVVVLRPDVHKELQKKARAMGISMGEVVRRTMGMDVPLLKDQMGYEGYEAQCMKTALLKLMKIAKEMETLCGE